MRHNIVTSYAVAEAAWRDREVPREVRSVALSDTVPVPVVVCSCGKYFAQRDFDRLPLGAGHRGNPEPVGGLVVRICDRCGSSVSTSDDPYDDIDASYDDAFLGQPDREPADDSEWSGMAMRNEWAKARHTW